MNNGYTILAFNDNADGEAYLTDVKHASDFKQAIFVAYILAVQYDHACVTPYDTFTDHVPLTFKGTAPYSIIIEIGHKYEL